jgi:hypothetical protein
MGKGQGSLRRTAMIGTFVASVMLALILPSIAFATVFSSLTPKAGSSSSVTKPKISVICRDDQGIVGASKTSMTLDGVKVAKKLTWYSGWGHRKFKITYAVPSALSLGSHTVVVRVTDRKYNHSSKTWHFHVVDRTAPVTTSDAVLNYTGSATINLSATDNAGGSGVAHTYYKLDGGAQTMGFVITVPAAVGTLHSLEFWSVDNAGNTETPHKAAIFQVTAVPVPPTPDPIVAAHQSTEWCGAQSGCHVSSLLVVHSASRCAVCHGDGPTAANALKYGIISTAAVKAAVAAGNTDCTACHNVFNTVPAHPFMTATTHTVNNGQPTGCYDSKCHASTDVSVIHTNGDDPPGCAACHAPGKTPSLVCGTCHPNLAEVHGFAHANASGTKSTACTACHGTDLPIVHTNVGCICHTASFLRAEMTPLLAAKTAECVDCHKGTHAAHDFNNTATGHNTTTYGTIGGKTKFDGSQGVTLHTIETSATSPNFGQVATLTTDWELPTANVFWKSDDASATATAIKGLTWNSVVTCQDCHTGLNAAGPHGATENWGIDPNYPGDYQEAELTKWIVTNPSGIKVRATDGIFQTNAAGLISYCPSSTALVGTKPYYSGMPTTSVSVNADGKNHAIICSKCHQLEVPGNGYMSERTPQAEPWMGDGRPGTTNGLPTFVNTGYVNAANIGGSNVAHGNHHFDTTAGDAQCVDCHIAIPHGWKRPRLLVNSGPNTAATVTSKTFDPVTDPYPYLSAKQHGTVDGVVTTPGSVSSNWGLYPTLDSAPRGMQSLTGDEDHEFVASAPGTNLEFGGDGSGNLSGPYEILTATTMRNPHGYNGVAVAGVPSTIAGYGIIKPVQVDSTHWNGTLSSTPTNNQNYVEWKEFQCEGCNDHKAAKETGLAPDSTGRVSAQNLGNYSATVRVKE